MQRMLLDFKTLPKQFFYIISTQEKVNKLCIRLKKQPSFKN